MIDTPLLIDATPDDGQSAGHLSNSVYCDKRSHRSEINVWQKLGSDKQDANVTFWVNAMPAPERPSRCGLILAPDRLDLRIVALKT